MKEGRKRPQEISEFSYFTSNTSKKVILEKLEIFKQGVTTREVYSAGDKNCILVRCGVTKIFHTTEVFRNLKARNLQRWIELGERYCSPQ